MENQVNTEKIIFEVVAGVRSKTQKGDISEALYQSGAISKDQYTSLKKRDPLWTGNPIHQKQLRK